MRLLVEKERNQIYKEEEMFIKEGVNLLEAEYPNRIDYIVIKKNVMFKCFFLEAFEENSHYLGTVKIPILSMYDEIEL